jgi:DNA polymerase-3 subunit beta
MSLNFVYITEPLKNIDSEYVTFNFNNDENIGDEIVVTKAIIMNSEPAGDYLHVIMPLKG